MSVVGESRFDANKIQETLFPFLPDGAALAKVTLGVWNSSLKVSVQYVINFPIVTESSLYEYCDLSDIANGNLGFLLVNLWRCDLSKSRYCVTSGKVVYCIPT